MSGELELLESISPDINGNALKLLKAKSEKMRETLQVQANKGSRTAKDLITSLQPFLDKLNLIITVVDK
jgi:hypothetical protein